MRHFHSIIEVAKIFDDMGASMFELMQEIELLVGDPLYLYYGHFEATPPHVPLVFKFCIW